MAPDWDLGDGTASTGETHRGHSKDKNSPNPDLTAAPGGPDAAAESEVRPEGDDGENGSASSQDGDDGASLSCPAP